MPHRRERHLASGLRRVMGLSPLVGVLGHRQVGKTTLLESISTAYHSFDDSDEILAASESAKDYVARVSGHWVALDECQTVPALFPALKEWVRKHPKPGQFILSGSVRFTSRKAIRESLTGRIINLELLPMLLSELHQRPLEGFWERVIKVSAFSESLLEHMGKPYSEDNVRKYFSTGGLPGVCFIRDEDLRHRKIDAQLETLLDRDLRMVVPTSLTYPQIRLLVRVLANSQGHPVSWSEIARRSGISAPTLKKLIYALESIFICRMVPIEGDVHGSAIFFDDMGEHGFLKQSPADPLDQVTHFLMLHIRGELVYRTSEPHQFFQYRTRAGVRVPLAVHAFGQSLGLIPIESDRPSRRERAAGASFLKAYGRGKVAYVTRDRKPAVLTDRELVIPVVFAG